MAQVRASSAAHTLVRHGATATAPTPRQDTPREKNEEKLEKGN